MNFTTGHLIRVSRSWEARTVQARSIGKDILGKEIRQHVDVNSTDPEIAFIDFSVIGISSEDLLAMSPEFMQ